MAVNNYLVVLIACLSYQAHFSNSAAVPSDDADAQNTDILTWARDAAVDTVVGPSDAVYCRVRSPSGHTVFEDFGVCRISVGRATEEHTGVWSLNVGRPGRVLTEDLQVLVSVSAAAPKPVVTVVVDAPKPEVILSCSVTVQDDVTGCKFRDPSGRILLATDGIGEDGYEFNGEQVQLQSGLQNHRCELRINNPQVADLGLWRCALETPSDTYYGFLLVLCPWTMQDPAVAAQVVTEPVLAADRPSITALEFTDSVTMSCSVQAPIRYCYFRNRSGRTMSIAPGNTGVDNAIAEYAGAGFDAGECGIRYSAMQASDSGAWTCHVGFVDTSMPEQRAPITVQIDEFMVARQEMNNNVLQIEGRVYWNRPLDYCRFVRIDGTGFTTENLPAGYTSNSVLGTGLCSLRISNPNILEHHPWAVVARVRGTEIELMRDTTHTIPGDTEVPDGHPDVEGGGVGDGNPSPPDQVIIVKENTTGVIVWMSLLTVMFFVLLISVVLSKKCNRDWVRRSISSNTSLVKAPLPADHPRDTAVRA